MGRNSRALRKVLSEAVAERPVSGANKSGKQGAERMGRDRGAAQSANIRTSPLMAPGAPQHQHGTDDDPRHMTSQCSQRSECGASPTGSDSTGGCSAGGGRRFNSRASAAERARSIERAGSATISRTGATIECYRARVDDPGPATARPIRG